MLRKSVVALILAALLSPVPHASADDFFDGPAAASGEPMFFSIYSILPWAVGVDNMQKIADGGFTSAGPYYGTESNPLVNPTTFYARVGQAADHGLKYIAQIAEHPDVINNTSGHIRNESMEPLVAEDGALLRPHVRAVMDATLNDPVANATVSAWYVQPEELRWWRGPEVEYLRIVADEIAAHDPQHRPVGMYNPNHRSSDELETMVNEGLDWTIMGVYATDDPFDTRAARVADGVNRVVTAAGNTQTKAVPVFQLSEDYDAVDVQSLAQSLGGVSNAEAIKQVIRNDTYQGLIRGADGIQIWSGFATRPGLTTFQEQLDGYISVSQDVNGDEGLADIFLQGENRDDLTITQTAGPGSVTYDTITIDTVAAANLAYGEGRTLVLANSSNEEISIDVSGLPTDEAVFLVNLADNATQFVTDSFAIDMMPLDVAPLQIFRSGDLNLDGVFNGDGTGLPGYDDVSAFVAGWRGDLPTGDVISAWCTGDMNLDGYNDLVDISLFQQALDYAGNPIDISHAVTVPEPSTVALLAMGLFCLLARRVVGKGRRMAGLPGQAKNGA